MDKFTENLAGGLRRFAMAGVGAVSLTIEKSREIIDQLVSRGEATTAEGQAACEELQAKMNEQLAAFTAKLRSDYEKASFDRLLQQCAALSPEQKALLIERLTAEPEPEQPDENSADEFTLYDPDEQPAETDKVPSGDCAPVTPVEQPAETNEVPSGDCAPVTPDEQPAETDEVS